MKRRVLKFINTKLAMGVNRKVLVLMLWGSLVSIILFTFFVFFYPDIQATMENSVLLWKAIYHGQLLRFYEYGLEHVTSSEWAPNYSILLYFVFAVYNIPIVIAEFFFQIDNIESVFTLLWGKGILILFSIGSAIMLEKIVRIMRPEKENRYYGLAAFLFLSSLNVVGPVFIITQYDIIAVFLILCGVYGYIQKRECLFLLFFMLAVPMKSFAVLYFIPLLILREKKILQIIFKAALIFGVPLIECLIFAQDTAYSFTVGRLNEWGFNRLLEGRIKIGEYNVSLFLIAFCGICLFCYFKSCKAEEDENREAVFSTILISMAIAVFIPLNTYWIVLVVPFLVLAATTQRYFLKLSILLEMVAGLSYTVNAILNKGPYNYTSIIKKLMLPKLIVIPRKDILQFGTAKALLNYFGLNKLEGIWGTLFVFCLICIAYLYFKDKQRENSWEMTDIKGITLEWLLAIRVFMLIGFMGLLLYANLKTSAPILHHIPQSDPIVSEISLIGNEMVQPFRIEEDRTISQVALFFDNDSINKKNFASLFVKVVDYTTGNILYNTRIGANRISSKAPLYIKLGDLNVESDHNYAIVLNGQKGTIKGKEYGLYPLLTQDYQDPFISKIYLNGIALNYQLYFEIK